MKFFLSVAAVFLVGLFVLTGCQDAAKPISIDSVKTNTNTNTPQKITNNSTQKVDSHGHVDDAPRITLADAKKDFDAGNAIFVDTRAEVQYKQEHIKGAINIPAEVAATRYNEIPKGKKIIAYCS